MSYGFGNDPLGITPFGTSLSAPAPDTRSDLRTVRDLDWLSNDFNVSGNAYTSISANKQRVLLALLTAKGSSTSMPEFGNNTLLIEKINPSTIERQVADYVKQALIHITEIDILSINVDNINNNNLIYTLTYIDNISGQVETLTLGS